MKESVRLGILRDNASREKKNLDKRLSGLEKILSALQNISEEGKDKCGKKYNKCANNLEEGITGLNIAAVDEIRTEKSTHVDENGPVHYTGDCIQALQSEISRVRTKSEMLGAQISTYNDQIFQAQVSEKNEEIEAERSRGTAGGR